MEKIILLFGLSACVFINAQTDYSINNQQYKRNSSGNVYQEKGDRFNSESENNILWKIEKEIKKVDDYKLQKATALFEGRKLTAWFTVEIENAARHHYMLGGLPGVILYVEDGQKDFIYKKNVKKTKINTQKAITS